MGKRNKRKQNSELLEKLCIGKDGKKINPFELKINKEKHQVLGRKQKKLIGLPTIAHKKSTQKRKSTILQEYIYRNKRNIFSDKRLHIEWRKIAQAVHQRTLESNILPLQDEELTHCGQSLSKIEKMEDPISDSDDEQLHAGFVKDAHFGGFLTEKKTDELVVSHKDLIKAIIAESKRKKYEKQSERETGIEITEKLDSEWKEIQHLLSKGAHKKAKQDKTLTSYDVTFHQLKCELRGGASDAKKKPEEITKEQIEKQMKLETDRKKRMDVCFDDVSDENCSEFPQKSVYSINTLLSAGSAITVEINKDNNKNNCVVGGMNFIETSPKNKTPTLREECQLCQIPNNLQEFIETTSEYSKEELCSFLNQIITNNKSQLDNLEIFKVIMEYACYIADNEDSDINELDILIPYLYELTESSAKVTAQYLLLLLKTAEQQFEDACKVKKHKKLQYPKLGTLIILKVCCILFPTSDFRHLIASPTLLFITRLLAECQVLNVRDILCGIFTCNLAVECVSYSKRFLPEALNFLIGFLSLIVHKDIIDLVEPHCHPFENYKVELNSFETNTLITINKLKLSDLRSNNKEMDSTLKLQLINYSIELLLTFSELYKDLPSYVEIFSSVSSICKNLCDINFPEVLNNKINKIVLITKSVYPKKYITQPKRPLKCLRFIEPRIEENFDGHRVRKGNKQHLEKEKLMHKYKQEMKGAVREIRHDNYFLANHWLNEQVSRDKERREKVKKIYQELANQEGDIRSLKRKKFKP